MRRRRTSGGPLRLMQGAERIHVLHLITTLDVGGTEYNLLRLVAGLDPARYVNSVVSLTTPGVLADEVRAAGGSVTCLGMRRGLDLAIAVPTLWQLLRSSGPTILQSWLYHADLLGALMRRTGGAARLIWNVRNTSTRLDARRPPLVGALAQLSGTPDVVVTNSQAGMLLHERFGYRPRVWRVIPNGIDTAEFHPDELSRVRVRHQLGIPPGAPVVGYVGRRHPLKDFGTLAAALRGIAARLPAAHFVVAGLDTEPGADHYLDAAAVGIGERLHLLGQRRDVAALMSAFDLLVLTSAAEGMPTVLGEAMSAGVPCVTTDVGDARELVGDTGEVVPVGDAQAIAEAAVRLLQPAVRPQLGGEARRRIQERYSLQSMVRSYERLYESVLAAGASPVAVGTAEASGRA